MRLGKPLNFPQKKIPGRHGYTEIFQLPRTDEVMTQQQDTSFTRAEFWVLLVGPRPRV